MYGILPRPKAILMMRLFTAVLSLCLILPIPSGAADWDAGEIDLLALSLEELMGIAVSLVSRTQQSFFETPAALFVLTADDVRRPGAANVQEALRLVPGVQAARATLLACRAI